MKNKTNEAPKAKKNRNINIKITGIAMLFVLASITYSTYVVAMGTTGIAPKVMLVPQAIWGVIIAIQKFTK